jgi:ABC-type multidrug transport system fused ATPase/permease subunit
MAERIGTALTDSLNGRALLLVTHRLSHLDDFDEILVMDNGRIIERGTEKDLLALGGRYAEMKRTQLDWIDADDEVGYVERG